MTQDLDKTIEDLEKEVVAELEEKAHDAPMKSAGKPDPMPKMKGAEKPEDLGGATPDKPVAKSPDSAKKIKHKTDDPAMKGAVKAEGYSDEEIRELCHSKDHDCATVVEHPVYGKGKPILKSHAIPDDNGFVEWYDVQFKHGIEEKVMAKDMKIIEESSHNKETKNMTKDNMINAMKDMMAQMNKEKKDVIKASYEAMTKAMEGEHEGEHEDGHKMETKKEYYEVDIKADVAALVENELAIERGLKGEIAEDFITGLKSLFEDHYIDVPNEKYDILEAQTQEIEELKNKVNDLIESKKGSVNRIGELVKESLVAKASDDLSETQKEKFKGLVEEVEFVSEESYSEKLKTLKESYFPNEEKKEEVLNEEPTTNNIDSSDVMAAYTAAIKKTHKRALNN